MSFYNPPKAVRDSILIAIVILSCCLPARAQNSSVMADTNGTFLSHNNWVSTNPFTFGANPANLAAVVAGTASSVAQGTNGILVLTNGSVYTVSFTGSSGGGGVTVAAGTNIWAGTNGSVITISGPPLPPSTNGLATIAYVQSYSLATSNGVVTLIMTASNNLYAVTVASTNGPVLAGILTNFFTGAQQVTNIASYFNGLATNLVIAQVGNPNHFATNGQTLSITSGVLLTNANAYGTTMAQTLDANTINAGSVAVTNTASAAMLDGNAGNLGSLTITNTASGAVSDQHKYYPFHLPARADQSAVSDYYTTVQTRAIYLSNVELAMNGSARASARF